METDDRIEKAKLHNEARELVQARLSAITEDSPLEEARTLALRAIALTLYAHEFLR